MASVKWIKQISIMDSTFNGPFQTINYVYYPKKDNDHVAFPVTTININSTIQKPLDMELIHTGKSLIKGIAWTEEGVITKVEISHDGGYTWRNADILPRQNIIYSWVSWSFEWTILKKGEFTIKSRATDSFVQIQPNFPFWNKKGYGYNAIDKIEVKVE
ncbi:hypothetical protein [Peribacillus simplex]|uniref:hypothetical protein n=1 Tax=Peribacillus simplex TaxID=1478 RepID=UPI003336A7AB